MCVGWSWESETKGIFMSQHSEPVARTERRPAGSAASPPIVFWTDIPFHGGSACVLAVCAKTVVAAS